MDCVHHIKNFIIGSISKACCSHINEEALDDLNDIETRLRVKFDTMCFMRLVDKDFNLSSNYPKGDGDSFHSFIEEYYPQTLLRHVKQVNGNRHDIVIEMAGPTHSNRRCSD